MAISTILDLYRHDVEAPRPDHYYHYFPGGRRVLSTERFFEQTAGLAQALDGLGVDRGDRVLLLSENRPEWHMADIAVLDLGAVDVPIYGTLTPEQIAYQANDSGAKAAIVESPEQMRKLLEISGQCPSLEHLIQIEGEAEPGVLRFDELIEASGSDDGIEARFWDRAKLIDEHDLMTIIYTSGTTGDPKGVMLTHANLVQNVLSSAPRIPVYQDDLALEFLPLCHVLERMVSYILMWRATTKAYCSVYHVGDLIAEIKPTLFTGVPRFYEKVYQKIAEKVGSASAVKRSLFSWAVDTGKKASNYSIAEKPMPALLGAQLKLAERIVLSKIREGIGGRVRFCISGGAELPLFVNEFFHAIGVNIMEGYGLTETSPVIAVNGAKPGMLRLGTVGKPLRNLEVKLASDGELLVKGPNVMKGYWNKPEATEEAFGADGFFHTGDIAELDDDGFLLIVDRKKDLIVTAGGKNVAPQPVESQLKSSRWVDTAVLIGDRRPFIVALISPSFEQLEPWAEANGISTESKEQLVNDPRVEKLFAEAIESVNSGMARFEQIKRFRVLPVTLSIEDGQLTPTLKVKRRVVERQFAEEIEQMFAQ